MSSIVVSGDFCRFKLALPSLLVSDGKMCKIFIFRNIYRCKSTRFSNGSSRNLTPSHTTRDAFMNKSLAFSRDVSLGHMWSSIWELNYRPQMYSANKLTGKVELLLAQEEWISLFSRGSFQRSIRSNFRNFLCHEHGTTFSSLKISRRI